MIIVLMKFTDQITKENIFNAILQTWIYLPLTYRIYGWQLLASKQASVFICRIIFAIFVYKEETALFLAFDTKSQEYGMQSLKKENYNECRNFVTLLFI